MKKKFRCLVCGFVYEGENPPERCPQCKAPATKFVEIKEDAEEPQCTKLMLCYYSPLFTEGETKGFY